MLQVAIGGDVDAVDLSLTRALGVEQRLDLLFGGVAQFPPVAVEDLDPVVLGGL